MFYNGHREEVCLWIKGIWAQAKPAKSGGVPREKYQDYAEQEESKMRSKMAKGSHGGFLLIHRIRFTTATGNCETTVFVIGNCIKII